VRRSLVIEQPRASCREQRQGIEVNLGSLSLGMDKLNAVTTEGGNRPSCRVAVRGDRGDAVAFENVGDLRSGFIRVERCLHLNEAVENRRIAFGMRNGGRKRIFRAAARIGEAT
jgi:hypothetical protein